MRHKPGKELEGGQIHGERKKGKGILWSDNGDVLEAAGLADVCTGGSYLYLYFQLYSNGLINNWILGLQYYQRACGNVYQ